MARIRGLRARVAARGALARAAATFAVILATAGMCSASVTVDQVYKIPASGAFTVIGHGFGHGHGMGQYGAEGAARAGLGYADILAFYYPGTAMGSVGGTIRVLITADTTDDVVVLDSPGLRVKNLATGTTYALTKAGASRWRIKVVSGQPRVYYRTSTGWHRYWRATISGDGEFSDTDGRLTLVTPSGQRTYRGALRSAAPSKGSTARDTVNVVSVENYVKGVVPAEMPASWSPQALRAQAVAARTYGMWSRQSRIDRSWQICDTTACQVYRGYDGEATSTNQAVDATAGAILTYNGVPAFTQFSASSGGYTSAGSVPYLPHQPDPYDDWSGNRVHSWSIDVKASVAQKKYPSIGTLTAIKVTRREGDGDWGGRVLDLTLVGTQGTKTLTGAQFRSLYGLRSNWFAIT